MVTVATVADRFAQVAAAVPDRVALKCDGEEVRYGELLDRVQTRAALLHTEPGCVCIAQSNGVGFVTELLSALSACKIALVFDPRTPTGVRLGYQVAMSDAVERPESRLKDFGVCAVFYTSGTSGRSHAVAHSNRSLMNGVLQYEERRNAAFPDMAVGEWPVQTTFVTQRLFLIAGASTLLRSLLFGDCVVTCRTFHPGRVLDAVAREEVEILSVTPVLAEYLLRAAARRNWSGRALKMIGLGGAFTSDALVRRLRATFGCAVATGYGSTELGGPALSAVTPAEGTVEGANAGAPLPGVEVRVIGRDGEAVAVGEFGRFECKSRGLMVGLVDEQGMLEPYGADAWFATGDVARELGDGRVEVLGRVDDVLSRGDRKILASGVESVLTEHPDVTAAAVTARSPAGRERIWAYVESRRNGAELPDELMKWCRERLSPVDLPSGVTVLSSLPKTADGKVAKSQILVDAGDSWTGAT